MARQWFDFSVLERVEKNRLDLGMNASKKIAIFRIALSSITLWGLLFGGICFSWSEEIHSNRLGPAAASHSSSPIYEVERLDHLTPSERPRVGDRLEMRLKGWVSRDSKNGAQEFKAEWIDPQRDSGESGWEWIEKPKELSVGNEFRFWVVPTRPGKLELPSFILRDASGKEWARSAPLLVEVASAISPQDPEPDQPYDLEPPVPLNFPIYWAIFLGILLIGFLGGLVVLFLRRRRSRGSSESLVREPLLPEDQIALNKLADLEQKSYYSDGDFKRHYFGVSEILKAYVGSRYRIDALEATTREMVSALSDLIQLGPPFSNEVNDARIAEIKKLFNLLDRVKFTDFQPDSAEAIEVIREARKWVEITRRQPESELSETSVKSRERVGHAIR